jgi:hypothetical protein
MDIRALEHGHPARRGLEQNGHQVNVIYECGKSRICVLKLSAEA